MRFLKIFSFQVKNNILLLSLTAVLLFVTVFSFVLKSNNQSSFLPESYDNRKLLNISKQITSWEREIEKLENSEIESSIKESVINYHTLSATLKEKHPKMRSLYTDIQNLFLDFGSKAPSHNEILNLDISKFKSSFLNQEKINLLKSQILNANSIKFKLESKKFIDERQEKNSSRTPLQDILSESALKSLALFSGLLIFWFGILVSRKKVSSVEELASAIEVDNIYSFPDLSIKKEPEFAMQLQQISSNSLEAEIEDLPIIITKEQTLPAEPSNMEFFDSGSLSKIRNMAAELQICARKQNRNIFLFASPEEHSGQETVTSNLSVAFAKYSSSVLLIDSNFYSPRLAERFGFSSEIDGFSDFLANRQSLKLCLQSTWQKSLYLLPAGKSKEQASHFLSSEKLVNVIQGFARRFDFVLIGCGSLEHNPASRFLADKIGGVYLVVDSKSNTLDVVENALLQLKNIDVKTEAVILNRV